MIELLLALIIGIGIVGGIIFIPYWVGKYIMGVDESSYDADPWGAGFAGIVFTLLIIGFCLSIGMLILGHG